MTTTNRMNNFKRLVERLAQGEKLLTTQEKMMIMTLRDSHDTYRLNHRKCHVNT